MRTKMEQWRSTRYRIVVVIVSMIASATATGGRHVASDGSRLLATLKGETQKAPPAEAERGVGTHVTS